MNDAKKEIKKKIKKGDFQVLRADKSKIGTTLFHLSKNGAYVLETRPEGLLAYNTATKKLTLYVRK